MNQPAEHNRRRNNPESASSDGGAVRGSSRRRFRAYRNQVRDGTLPKGSIHSSTNHGDPKVRARSSIDLIRRFLKLLRPFRRTMIFALSTLTVATLLGLIPPAATKFIVDYVLGNQPVPKVITNVSAALAQPKNLLVATVSVVILVSLLRAFVHILGRWQATQTTKHIQLMVRRHVFEHAVRLPLHRVQELRSGGVASILREDGGSVGELVFGMLYNPWRAVIQLVGSMCILAWVDWTLLVGAIVLVPIVFFTHRTWINRIRPQFRAIRKQRELIDGTATETFAGMRVVRAFSRQKREAMRFQGDNHLMVRQELLAWWWMRTIELAWETMLPVSSAALLLYGGFQVLNGTMTLGDLMMFLVYLLMLLEPLAVLAQSAAAFQNSLSGLDRVLDLLDEDQEMQPSPDSIRLQSSQVDGEISFRDVTFRYPGTDAPALEDISLTVPAGSVVALVGPSGAGKTTLCNLVARFYDPGSGTVTLDGRDLRNIEVESFRSLLGVVEQDVFLFDGTIGENIAYAAKDAREVDIVAAAEAANAMEFIDRLPLGLNTIIGERGVRLSGGQRQRLAIARAILADPRLLILDEATSNLDTESEQLIQQSLATLMRGRTCFVIAHRLSTIAGADQIVVLEDGHIVQTGTHEELMKSVGRYRGMVELQVQTTLGSTATISM